MYCLLISLQVSVMENDLDIDFQGHITSYLSVIFLGEEGSNFKHNDFVFIKSTVLRYFHM